MKNIKIIARSALAVIIPYLIFTLNWHTSLKILAVATMCLIILIFYIYRAGGFRALSIRWLTLIVPTCSSFVFSLLNFALSLNASALAVWIGFIGLTLGTFILVEVKLKR